MDPSSWLLIAVYILFTLLSAYFAACESAYSAVNKIRLKVMAEDGDRRAKRAMYIVNNFDRTLTTVLIGINVCHIGAGTLATLFAVDHWRENRDSATLVATIVTTVVMFLVAEMLPKSFAKNHADTTALAFAPSMRLWMRVIYPFSLFFLWITKLVTRVFGAKDEPTITEDELVDIIENAEEEGTIEEEQSDLLQSAIEFSSTDVSEVLTMREDIEAIEVHTPLDEIMTLVQASTHSRIPVYDRDLDHIVGVLPVRKFLSYTIRKKLHSVREILSPVTKVLPTEPIDELLAKMSRAKTSLVVVTDTEGKTLGLATTEDFLEELVGEIWDETDKVNEHFIKLGGGRFEVSAALSLKEMFTNLSYSNRRPLHGNPAKTTVGEWARSNIEGDVEEDVSFAWDDLEVTVSELSDDGVIEKVVVKVPSPELDAAVEKAERLEAALSNEGEEVADV